MANWTITQGEMVDVAVTGLRRMFYLVTPAETSYPHLHKVPEFVDQAIPVFVVFMIVEMCLSIIKGNGRLRDNDGMSSVAAGLLSLIPLLLTRNIELVTYLWVWENWRIKALELSWNNPWTWLASMIGTDFFYYWIHRFTHEVRIMWATHQVHHSSEEYNYTTALRQPIHQRYVSWMFYLPMAFIIPPQIFYVHLQFSLLYQFWIHTEMIGNLGPIEWIFNTPSHHRVHHGRNKYCMDKNYASVFILLDRIFGTFEAERENEKPEYGLTTNVNSWDPIYIQFHEFVKTFKTSYKAEGLKNKLLVFFKGPGWRPPGVSITKRKTNTATNVKKLRQVKYDKRLRPLWWMYCWFHFVVCAAAYGVVIASKQNIAYWQLVMIAFYMTWTLMNIGYLYEHKWYGPLLEALRCAVYLFVDLSMCCSETWGTVLYGMRLFFTGSLILSLLKCARLYKLELVAAKKVD